MPESAGGIICGLYLHFPCGTQMSFPIHWHRLPREAVAAPFLAVFKARLDGALSNLVWWKMSLLVAGGLEPDDV